MASRFAVQVTTFYLKRGTRMKRDRWRQRLSPARRKLIWSKLHVLIAAIGTLTAVAGIAVAINGGLEFNRTKVLVGAGIIVVSTIVYISMLFVPDSTDDQ